MKAIKVPVEGNIELVDIPDHENYPEMGTALFGHDTLVERVRFGRLVNGQPTVFMSGERMVVMLVNEDGHAEGEPLNPRATLLYRSGVHDGVIPGDAYLVMERRDMLEGDVWSDIEQPYATPDFWMEVCDA